LLRDVLDRESWDLFFGAFSEAHCVGHHLWHLHDETSPLHDPDAPPELRNGVREVYTLLDEALGRVLEKAGDTTTTLVFLSHGMGPNVGGWQLLPEILLRLGYTPPPPATVSIARRLLPAPAKWVAKRFVRRGGATSLRSAAGLFLEPLESPRTRAVAVRNGRNGAIRLNVAGRDPFGSIQPGEEYDAACAELTRELEALRDTTTGEPIVEAVLRADVVFGKALHPNIPDLIVHFRGSRPITSVTSPRVGTVSTATRAERRTGDHTPHSRLWAHGPGIVAGRSVKGGHVLDLAPTVLELLDVPVPAGLDGSALKLRDHVVV
jgi:predicted AlkP superfamily phosphohydrolase/phosphomutase